MTDIVARLRGFADTEMPVEALAVVCEAADELERLRLECEEWRECALYDPKMEGPAFKGWNRSSLDRCRTQYIELGNEIDRLRKQIAAKQPGTKQLPIDGFMGDEWDEEIPG